MLIIFKSNEKQLTGLTQTWFRELSFSRLECGVHDRLHICPLFGIFYFTWHRQQIEGTSSSCNGAKRTFPSFEAAIQTLSYHVPQEIQSLMLRATFLHIKYNMPCPGIEPRKTAYQVDVLTTTLPTSSSTEPLTVCLAVEEFMAIIIIRPTGSRRSEKFETECDHHRGRQWRM